MALGTLCSRNCIMQLCALPYISKSTSPAQNGAREFFHSFHSHGTSMSFIFSYFCPVNIIRIVECPFLSLPSKVRFLVFIPLRIMNNSWHPNAKCCLYSTRNLSAGVWIKTGGIQYLELSAIYSPWWLLLSVHLHNLSLSAVHLLILIVVYRDIPSKKTSQHNCFIMSILSHEIRIFLHKYEWNI